MSRVGHLRRCLRPLYEPRLKMDQCLCARSVPVCAHNLHHGSCRILDVNAVLVVRILLLPVQAGSVGTKLGPSHFTAISLHTSAPPACRACNELPHLPAVITAAPSALILIVLAFLTVAAESQLDPFADDLLSGKATSDLERLRGCALRARVMPVHGSNAMTLRKGMTMSLPPVRLTGS